jgi:hypothetical protein
LSALGLLSVMRATPGSGRDVRMLVYWVDIRRIDADTIKRFVWGARRADRRMRWDIASVACYLSSNRPNLDPISQDRGVQTSDLPAVAVHRSSRRRITLGSSGYKSRSLAMISIFRTRQFLVAPAQRITSIGRFISTTSPNRHMFFVYAPDKTDQGTFQRRLSVRPKHLVRSTQMFECGFIST